MSPDYFDQLLESEFVRIRNVLSGKAKEYATEDRLHNFKASAAMGGDTPKQALWGMARKHFISVSDMIHNDHEYTYEVWEEKIGDAVNYLLLLKALVTEEAVHINPNIYNDPMTHADSSDFDDLDDDTDPGMVYTGKPFGT